MRSAGTAWWSLATIASRKGEIFDRPLSATLFLIGGFGPTIAAFAAVAWTQAEGTLGEYAARLFRWRVNPVWWLAALGVPAAVAWVIERIDVLAAGSGLHLAPFQPLSHLLVLFPTMIIGGGLEELGWRGVAQPELERRCSRVLATSIVGIVWALWHLPLFFIPGVVQYGGNFGVFALEVLGAAFLTAWIYDSTNSILLCVLFHAASNAANAIGLKSPDGSTAIGLLGGAVGLAIGVSLVMSLPRVARAG